MRAIEYMNDETNYLSKEKFDELTTELEHLKTVRRREIAEQLEYARSLGDLSENAEYEEARNLQAATEDRIRVIEEQLSHARIIEHTKGNTVSLGNFVTIQKQGEKDEHVYEIVGSCDRLIIFQTSKIAFYSIFQLYYNFRCSSLFL